MASGLDWRLFSIVLSFNPHPWSIQHYVSILYILSCLYLCIYVYTYVHNNIYIDKYTYMYIHHVYTYIYIRYTHMYTYTYTYVHIHVHIHIHIHIHIHHLHPSNPVYGQWRLVQLSSPSPQFQLLFVDMVCSLHGSFLSVCLSVCLSLLTV